MLFTSLLFITGLSRTATDFRSLLQLQAAAEAAAQAPAHAVVSYQPEASLELPSGCYYVGDTWDWCRTDQVTDPEGQVIPRNNTPTTFKISLSEHYPWKCGTSQEAARIYKANTIVATITPQGRIHWVGYYC